MQRFRDFLKRKDIEISLRRYGIDALGAMAQGLFCSLLIGTILNTLGQQFHIGFLNAIIFTLGKGDAAVGYTIGGCASLMVGPAMAVAIGYALHAPAMVLFSLVPVGYATNAMGGAGGPLAVLVTAIIAAEFGKAVSKETKVDILVTPIVTILVGIGLAMLVDNFMKYGLYEKGDIRNSNFNIRRVLWYNRPGYEETLYARCPAGGGFLPGPQHH